MKKQYLVNNLKQTKELAGEIAEKARKSKKPFIIGLEGELGSGKTTFTQFLAKALGIKHKILSPTFVILKRFETKNKSFYHIDCYRIRDPKEILNLGFEEIINNPRNVAVIEWAGKIKKIMPKDSLWLKFKIMDEKTRKITILR